jgi:c-di-GMP phosphodiesterase
MTTNPIIMEEKTLTRLPYMLTFVIVLMLGLPAVGMTFGINLDRLALNLGDNTLLQQKLIKSHILGYITQIIIQWSAFSLAVITTILAYTQNRLTQDKASLIIGLAVLFSGSISFVHMLLLEGFSQNTSNKENLDALIWVFSNSICAFIIILGTILILRKKDEQALSTTTFFLLNIFLVVFAFALIYYAAFQIALPQMWYKDAVLSRPYELIPLSLFLIIAVFCYPKLYDLNQNIIVNGLFYMAITQCAMAMYMMLLSNAPFDSGYNFANFLKVVFYFIPLCCLIIHYSYSYRYILRSKKILQKQKIELKYLATHDILTNVLNRRAFEEEIAISCANARRDNHQFALLIIDLDNLKRINDCFGHNFGDSLIKSFARRLKKATRLGDKLSRLGGDEFAIITPKLKSTSNVRSLADRLLFDLSQPYEVENQRFISTASIGIALYPDDALKGHDLLKHADMALYEAKKTGRNTYEYYTKSLSIYHHSESKIEAHLREALERNELSIVYQPKYNIINNELVGAEALLRWHNPTLGEVVPDDFIDVAEKTGLIITIGEWVLENVCKQAKEWLVKYQLNLLYSVNLSPIQLTNRNFSKKIKHVLKKYDYPANQLELEITENLLMESNLVNHRILYEVNKLGVLISIDDFGKGYSSLNRLRQLPISILKIDKSFISDIKSLETKSTLVDLIIELAHQLGMNLVAEGIENQIQLDYLASRNCIIGQGFHLSKPLSITNFDALLGGVTKK